MKVEDALNGAPGAGASFTAPALLRDLDVAALLQISRRQIHRLRSAGQLPAPLRIGGAVRWRADEIAGWIEANCPPLEVWERRRR